MLTGFATRIWPKLGTADWAKIPLLAPVFVVGVQSLSRQISHFHQNPETSEGVRKLYCPSAPFHLSSRLEQISLASLDLDSAAGQLPGDRLGETQERAGRPTTFAENLANKSLTLRLPLLSAAPRTKPTTNGLAGGHTTLSHIRLARCSRMKRNCPRRTSANG